MFKVKVTASFKKDYDSLPQSIQKKAKKVIGFLKKDFRYPLIRAKKIKGARDTWEGRVNRFYRFTFRIEEDIVYLRHIGSHNRTLKTP